MREIVLRVKVGIRLAGNGAGSLALAALSYSGACFGQSSTASSGATGGVTVDSATLAQAEQLFEQAEQAAQQHDYARALDLMQKSYEACGRQPQLLFNLGTIHRELGHCDEATSHFEQYLERAATGRFRAEAEEALASLRKDCKAKASSAPVAHETPLPHAAEHARTPVPPRAPAALPARSRTNATAPEAPQSRTLQRSIAFAAFGVGIVAAGTAGYFAWKAKERDEELDALVAEARRTPPPDRPSWSAKAGTLSDERDGHRTRAIAFGAVSGVFLATGFTILFYPKSSPTRAPAATLIDVEVGPSRVFARLVAASF